MDDSCFPSGANVSNTDWSDVKTQGLTRSSSYVTGISGDEWRSVFATVGSLPDSKMTLGAFMSDMVEPGGMKPESVRSALLDQKMIEDNCHELQRYLSRWSGLDRVHNKALKDSVRETKQLLTGPETRRYSRPVTELELALNVPSSQSEWERDERRRLHGWDEAVRNRSIVAHVEQQLKNMLEYMRETDLYRVFAKDEDIDEYSDMSSDAGSSVDSEGSAGAEDAKPMSKRN